MFDDFKFEEELAPATVDSNINKQASKIIKSITEAYLTGLFDDPKSGHAFCQLLACVCEGKVEGLYNPEKMAVEWSLTSTYQDKLTAEAAALESAMAASGKIVAGPWTNTTE